MDELLAKAMAGVDPQAPGAFLTIFMNLMRLVPWGQLVLWQVVFIVVGALLGWWRGRVTATVVASLVLGPFGWAVPFLPRPPAAPAGPARASLGSGVPPVPRHHGALPPPLPGSKKP
ncbi:hypothetical protein [Luteibacter aegosomatissinici]|uniref:hypothetical protein n=1 Tax=Luteibacter aegosomatissinici TaxID=2911539 RepID=UPI001FFA3D4D|nr:hypothetical protein [Luteibacter aegosomatissinici]UPG96145.1 hypothetical protein L2Y97_08560 [Luteibacter aegosomatissinici]